jgi:8-oxo-dGTP pyrophosphatase MutT (NUDIX family)
MDQQQSASGMAVEGKPQAAVAIVRAAATDSVLLIRRTEHPLDPWSGHWSFPGGRCDATDASLLASALRELHEECGLSLEPEQLRRALPLAIARRRTPPFMVVAPFVFEVATELASILDPEEAVEARWLPLSEWRDPLCHRLRPVPGMPQDFFFPALQLEPVPVWGFTYRLATEWLGLLPPGPVATAGLRWAQWLLELLLASGLRLLEPWSAGSPRTAVVAGAIPTETLAAALAEPQPEFPAVNKVELRSDFVSVLGMDFEEYLIRSA